MGCKQPGLACSPILSLLGYAFPAPHTAMAVEESHVGGTADTGGVELKTLSALPLPHHTA